MFLLTSSTCQNSKPYDNPFREKSNSAGKREERKKERKMPLIVATTFAQQPSPRHQGSACTPLGPIWVKGRSRKSEEQDLHKRRNVSESEELTTAESIGLIL